MAVETYRPESLAAARLRPSEGPLAGEPNEPELETAGADWESSNYLQTT